MRAEALGLFRDAFSKLQAHHAGTSLGSTVVPGSLGRDAGHVAFEDQHVVAAGLVLSPKEKQRMQTCRQFSKSPQVGDERWEVEMCRV